MSKSLPTLLNEASELENQLVALAGELTPELEQALMQLEIAIPNKVQNYINLLDRLELETDHLYDKGQKFLMASKALGNLRQKLLDNIKNTMVNNQLSELRGSDEVFTITKGKPKVVVGPDAKLPPELVETTIETRPRKDEIRARLERGDLFHGISLEPTVVLKRRINKGIK